MGERLRFYVAVACVIAGSVSAAREFTRLNAAARQANALIEHAKAIDHIDPALSPSGSR